MRSVPTWVTYTAWRLLAFAVPLAVLLIAGVSPWISALVAALFGLSVSVIFLRRPRDTMSEQLYAARNRETPAVHEDDAAEDAAVDAAAVDAADAEPEGSGSSGASAEQSTDADR
ncbi:DUF4229 domain-containing protein [Agromyces mangrovi Wang et al. 2018]|uniref:DUF4229 domain-containing protein n=1 Tax=Agromyces mangrovi TaxID=1858653 RepID=UPI00257359F4|nr:DUF4229 domain-containing protein [Agromyces mangrovi]